MVRITCMQLEFWMRYLYTGASFFSGWTSQCMRECLYFSKIDVDRPVPDLLFNVAIRSDFTWMLSTCGVEVTGGTLIDSLPQELNSVCRVKTTLLRLHKSYVCTGNSDGKFSELKNNPYFLKSSSKFMYMLIYVCVQLTLHVFTNVSAVYPHDTIHARYTGAYATAYVESRLLGSATIRHKHCELVVENNTCCPACQHHRNTLHSIHSRIEKYQKREKKIALLPVAMSTTATLPLLKRVRDSPNYTRLYERLRGE